ncbi:hypothetical protein G6027_00425, partial [Dietzia sp. SLG310A2-38A2]|uniref:hypothetical protein n=1 Tax=Dietzia sp. SLG310A2-38A2 TaxID=1630643 RepID=UPI0015F9B429
MNPEQPDHIQRTLADLDARLGRITAEMAEVRSGLAALGRQARSTQPGQPAAGVSHAGRADPHPSS